MACSGTPFKRWPGYSQECGRDIVWPAGQLEPFTLVFTFKLVAVKTISWAHDDEAPKETVTFEYGGLNIQYYQQQPDGKPYPPTPGGWNRVKNI